MSFVDLAAFKAYLRIEDSLDDAELQSALDTATSEIEHICSRTFEVASGTPTTRYFQPWWETRSGRWILPTDDVVDTAGYVVNTWTADDTAWTTPVVFTGGDPWRPINRRPGFPYTSLILPAGVAYGGGTYAWWSHRVGWHSDDNADYVAVTANWGWPEVPAAVQEACKMQASRTFKRRDATFGVTASPDGSENTRLTNTVDVDVQVALRGYIKYWGAKS